MNRYKGRAEERRTRQRLEEQAKELAATNPELAQFCRDLAVNLAARHGEAVKLRDVKMARQRLFALN